MDILVYPEGLIIWQDRSARCVLGRSGVIRGKREGDGGTPVGCFPLRSVYYRADRLPAPETGLPVRPLRPEDGWCDDPDDPAYNRPVTLPYGGRHERLWREDNLYDLIVVLGHNDHPVQSGMGSAIFMHVATETFRPTEGCVAMALPDLQDVLRNCHPGSQICIRDTF